MRIKEVDIIDKDDFKNEDGHKNEVNLRHEELMTNFYDRDQSYFLFVFHVFIIGKHAYFIGECFLADLYQ